ncbi:MAG: hypothetical protein PHI27_09875 [Eubacteriales bacterium]|nr:hypothetical protein [Eubacteriales bacterium]
MMKWVGGGYLPFLMPDSESFFPFSFSFQSHGVSSSVVFISLCLLEKEI